MQLQSPPATPAGAATALLAEPGQAWPTGAHWQGRGVNFAVFSAHAQAIDLCLFDDAGTTETARLRLPGHTGNIWHGFVPGLKPGQLYGLRAHGPWRPDKGHRFNPHKLLLDPYAREIVGTFVWDDEHFAADREHARQMDMRDNGATALKARVVHDDNFDWGDDRAPQTALADTVVYELHIKGFSRLNPAVPPALRGTYAGLGHEASTAHLKRLGVTALSVLPVHHHIDEERLCQRGLGNYWGYNTIGYFSPDPRFGSSSNGTALRDEFRGMVKSLHRAGIEVLLDVVYNHTAESDSTGPCISFQGLDNASYYRLVPGAALRHDDHTGCGNTVDIRHPRVLQLVMDSLRYWVTEMHVDGFRFDLATTLGRGDHGFERDAAFFTALAQDPVLSRVKTIAEPWDVGPNGYQVGGFPNGWFEWNDKFRDEVRSFWLQHPASRGGFAQRLCASSDVYEARGRAPAESLNYVVSHDGFTLRDLLTYRDKRNLANFEANRDGTDNNLGFNCGAEGDSSEPAVKVLRARLQRALLATTLLAQGTPMLCAGDELGHTQGGNNNPYCHDSEITWIDWSCADAELIEFTRRAIELRRQALPFGNRWYSGSPDPRDPHGLHDLSWLGADGTPLHGEAWNSGTSRVLGCLIGAPGRARAPLLLLMNADAHDHQFALPSGVWQVLLDTTQPMGAGTWHGQGGVNISLPASSLQVLAAAGSGIRL